MNIRDTILRSVIYILGGLATVGFFMTKDSAALNWATRADYHFGDLYRLAKIERFKPAAPLVRGQFANRDSIDQGGRKPDESDVIYLGDSFGFADWGQAPFQMQLQQKVRTPFFSVLNNNHREFWLNPYSLIPPGTNRDMSRHVFVYETVERLIPLQFSNPFPTNPFAPAHGKSFGLNLWTNIKGILFDNSEARSETLLYHSFVTSPLVGLWNTAVFELFGRVPVETPLYSLNPPSLFYQDEVESFDSVHDDPMVDTLADNISLFDRNLRERFGYTLYFIPIPDKITVYSRLATTKPYDDFLPRLCSALKKRGVHTVEILPAFQQQTNMLYWPTDTHWNNTGISIAVEQTLKNWP